MLDLEKVPDEVYDVEAVEFMGTGGKYPCVALRLKDGSARLFECAPGKSILFTPNKRHRLSFGPFGAIWRSAVVADDFVLEDTET